jgi:hypothetical protein
MQLKRRQALFLFSGGLLATATSLVGCGGGSKNSSNVSDATRKQVTSIHQLSLGARSILDPMLRRNGYFGKGGIGIPIGGGTTGGGAGGGGNATPPPGANDVTPINAMGQNLLLPGAGFKEIMGSANLPSPSRKYRPTQGKRGGDAEGIGIAIGEPHPWNEPGPWNGFYYDYYLELWVQFVESPTESRTNYYIDEAKTQSAGYSVNTHPIDWSVYPQTYTYDYKFTAGTLSGSHGKSSTTVKSDYSGETSYENVYADGWKDTGKSTWFPNGASTWFSRTDMADAQWIESVGSFRPDGTGGTRTKLSTGFEANYTYNADGSGSGKITGPDPLLPITITWNYCGDTRIQYADGTIEEQEGWCRNNYPYPGPYIGGTTGGGGGEITTLPAPEKAP